MKDNEKKLIENSQIEERLEEQATVADGAETEAEFPIEEKSAEQGSVTEASDNGAKLPLGERLRLRLVDEESVEHAPLLKQAIVIFFAANIRALAMNIFVIPNRIAPGGVSGISSILYNTLGWNASITLFAFNIPLLLLAFFFINKRFAVATTVFALGTSGFMEVWSLLPIPVFSDDTFVASIMSGILNGFSLAMLLRINCSAGGSDIVGLLLQNRFPTLKTVWIIFAADAVVAAAAGIAFTSLSVAIYSLVTIFVGSFVADITQKGYISTMEFKIISDKEDEIAEYVMAKLHHGATHLAGTGMYSGKPVNYIVCVVRKRQVQELKRAIKRIDPEAFYYVTGVRDIVGKGFNNNVNPTSKI